MTAHIIQDLPMAHRLALAYAPAASREDTLNLLALDARLAGIVRGKGEAIIAQMKLAWWRDRLRDDPANWPKGEPLLARLQEGSIAAGVFAPMVDGWEVLLAERLEAGHIHEFADGRAQGWAGLAEATGADRESARRAGREFALADLAVHLGDRGEAREVRATALDQGWQPPRLGRKLRSLAVLHALARRALRQDHGELLAGPGAALLAMRVGIAGR
jgi:phytoene synthase